MSGTIGGGLIPMGNGGFVDPLTGRFVPPGQAASVAGSMVGNTAANGATASALAGSMGGNPNGPPASAQAISQAASVLGGFPGTPSTGTASAPSATQGATQGPPPGVSVPTSPAAYPGSAPASASTAAPSAPQQQPGGLSPQTLVAIAAARQKVQQAQQAAAQNAAPASAAPAAGSPSAAPAPSQGGAVGGTGGSSGDISSYLPPSYSWLANVAKQESGGNPNAANSASSAKGPFQFTDGTWNVYLQTPDAKAKGYGPGDVTNPKAAADGAVWLANSNNQAISAAGFPNMPPGALALAHVTGAGDTVALLKASTSNPNAPIGPIISAVDPNAKAVFAGNPGLLDPNATVAQTFAKFGQYAAGTYKSGGTQLAANGASDVPLGGPQGGSSPAPGGIMGTYQQMLNALPQPKALPQAPQLQGAPQLYGTSVNGPMLGLEFASGLLGAPSIGQGLGRAFGNLTQGYQDQTQYANKARVDATGMNNEAAQGNVKNQFDVTQTGNDAALSRAQAALQLAQFMRPKPLGLSPIQQANGSWAMPMQQQDGSITFQPLPNGATPEKLASGQQQEANKQLADNYKQSVTDLSTQRSSVLAGIDNQRNVDNLLNLLPTNGAAIGPSVGARIIKEFVNLTGLPAGSVTPDGNALTPQAVNDLKLGELPGLKSLFPRGFAGPELKMVNGILPNEDMNPQAVAALAQEMKADIQRRTATIGLWDKLPPDQQNAIMSSPGGFAGWFGQAQQQAYGDTGAQPDPGASISASGQYTGTAGYKPQGAPQGQPTSAAPSVPQVATAADYAALPSGASYLTRLET